MTMLATNRPRSLLFVERVVMKKGLTVHLKKKQNKTISCVCSIKQSNPIALRKVKLKWSMCNRVKIVCSKGR